LLTIKSVEYRNFLSTGNVPIKISFDHSCTAISGKNAQGKSTFMDALFFTMYGKTLRKLKKEQIINSINKKDLLVTLELQDGGKSYKIVRGIKPNIFEIYVDDVLREPPAAIKDYQLWLENSVLKMNESVAKQLILLNSTSFVPFMMLAPKQRRSVVEEILDIQVFSTISTLIRGRSTILSTKYNDLISEISLLTNSIKLKQEHLADIGEKKENLIKEKQDRIVELKKDIAEIHTNISKANQEISENNHKISDAATKRQNRAELDKILSDISTKQVRLKKHVEFVQNNSSCPTCQQEIGDDFRERTVNETNSETASLQATIDKATTMLKEFDHRLEEIRDIERTIQNINMDISNNNTRIDAINGHIKSIESDLKKLETAENSSDETILQEIADIETNLAKTKLERDELVDSTQYLRTITSLLKDSGIKTKIIKQYLPTINSLIRKYLEILEFPCEFTFDEEFNETMKSRYRDKFSYDNFSAGQKCRIDLALLFAWRDLSRLRNSSACNLLVLDEIGSSSLDADGVQAFMKIVSNLDKTNVVVISHDQNISESDAFERHLKFKLKDNFSTVEEIV